MKKIIALMAVFLLCASAASCGNPSAEPADTQSPTGTGEPSQSDSENDSDTEPTPTQPSHTHTPSNQWELNVKEHWQTCTEDGEKIRPEAHSINEENLCVVCGGSILEYTDGTGWTTCYNERGQTIRTTAFDTAGNKVHEDRWDYAEDANGTWYVAKTTEFDQAGNRIYVEEFNEYGDLTATSISNLEGQIMQTNRFERGYDEQGNMLWEFSYTNDVLIQEQHDFMTYENDRISRFFPKKTIDYYEDGSQVLSIRNDMGLLIKKATYLADGSLAHQMEYEHVFADHGGFERIRVYENGRLRQDTEYAISTALGIIYVIRDTEFHEDGSKTLREYDERSQLVGEYTYDAEGNLME